MRAIHILFCILEVRKYTDVHGSNTEKSSYSTFSVEVIISGKVTSRGNLLLPVFMPLKAQIKLNLYAS